MAKGIHHAPWEKAFDRLLTPLEEFIHRQTTSGVLLMICAVIALVIFAIKRSGLADATSLPGIWFFALAAVLSIVAARLLETRGRAGI